MRQPPNEQAHRNELWRSFLMGEDPSFHRFHRVFRVLPASPRCKVCYSPFAGMGGVVMRLIGRGPARMNPNLCGVCETFATKYPGGAEVPLTMLFADIRGSTKLAESLGTSGFTDLIARFYDAVTRELLKADALIDRLIGDEVIALFVPVLTGDRHAELAVKAALGIMKATGHEDEAGPWVPLGIGIHTGTAFVGSVGSSGVSDITALGDDVNLTARLASAAADGEIILTDVARTAAGLSAEGLEPRSLELKGKRAPVDTWLMRAGAPAEAGTG